MGEQTRIERVTQGHRLLAADQKRAELIQSVVLELILRINETLVQSLEINQIEEKL